LRFALRAALTGEAGSRNTGDTSLKRRLVFHSATGEDEAGVGERSRSPRSRLPLWTARVAAL